MRERRTEIANSLRTPAAAPDLTGKSVATPFLAATPQSTGESYTGERENRIAALQQELDNINVDIRNCGGNTGSHIDGAGVSHPNYLGGGSDRANDLYKKRSDVAEKIAKLKRGDPVSSVNDPETPSSGLNSMDNVPRL